MAHIHVTEQTDREFARWLDETSAFGRTRMNDTHDNEQADRAASAAAYVVAIPGSERTWYRVTLEADVLAKDAVEAGQIAVGPGLTTRERRVVSVVPRGFRFPLRLGDADAQRPSVFVASPVALPITPPDLHLHPDQTHCIHADDGTEYCCMCTGRRL